LIVYRGVCPISKVVCKNAVDSTFNVESNLHLWAEENAVAQLTGKELEVLLCWKGVPVLKMGNVANRWVLYQQFADGGEEEEDDAANIPAPWTDANEARLVALRNAPIEMADTSYGRFLATQKRDAERAYQHMDAEEREAFLRKLTEIDADDTEDRQSPPSNPTPV
jgi:hypothetical protein